MSEQLDQRVIKSYVWHGDECFFVSTIERDSSAMLCPSRYNETLVWRHDWKTQASGEMLYQESDIRGSISRHLWVCSALFEYGKLPQQD